jgi:hypothetical protein
MVRHALVLLLLLPWLEAGAECECLWQGSFADIQADSDLVVTGMVVTSKGNSIDLLAGQALRGPLHQRQIRIWLKTGDYCRPEVELFPVQSTWVMALDRIDETVPGGFNPNTPNISYGRVGDYQLSSCGGYWLKLEGDAVTGNLVDAPRWAREPQMTPVLLEVVAAYVRGEIDQEALLDASREDPELRDLKLDTKAFLRGDE